MPPHRKYILLGIIMALLCAGLSVWQVRRGAEKTQRILDFETQAHRAPMMWQGETPKPFTHLEIQGTLNPVHTLRVIGRFHAGQPGYHVVVPLETPHGSVLLDLGWVASTMAQDTLCLPEGVSTFTCSVREFAPSPPWFLSQNRPEAREFVRLSRTDIRAALGPDKTRAPFYCACTAMTSVAEQPTCMPIPTGAIQPDWHNHHTGYALTWAALALIGLLMAAFGYRQHLVTTHQA